MKYFYIGGFLLWTGMLVYLVNLPSPGQTAQMTVKLNTLTPIVSSGYLTITGSDGGIRVLDVEAGDTFTIRSTPE